MRVSLMITCLADTLFPEVGEATVRLLRRLGVEVDFPRAQTCCGQPHYNSGYPADARAIARHAVRTFDTGRTVVVPSGSCAAMVKCEYPGLFADDQDWKVRAEDLAARTFELSEFLVRVLKVEDVGAWCEARVTYHLSCHLRGLGLTDEPERLLGQVRGLKVVTLERADECCGFGGSFAVRYPEVSGAMVTDKAAAVERTGADAVVATDAGCLMNMAGCMRRQGSRVRALHLAQVLAATEGKLP